jgi:hypothetical protein
VLAALALAGAGTGAAFAHTRAHAMRGGGVCARLRHATALLALGSLAGCGTQVPSLGSPRSPGEARAAAAGACQRPYSEASAWNTAIRPQAAYDPNSAALVATIPAPVAGSLTSDPTQYDLTVYYATNRTPMSRVTYSGWFSDVLSRGLTDYRYGGDLTMQTVGVRIPSGARPPAGSDGNVAIINTDDREEWDLHALARDATGAYTAANVGHYNLKWSGSPPLDRYRNPWMLRGAGVPYLAGLVRPCEIAQGHIDHALALGIRTPSSQHVYPATKSDGFASPGAGIPEGGHLQLDPTIPDSTITGAWGCTGACYVIAKAMQRYGIYVLDTSGRPKIAVEDEITANWGNTLTASTVSPIPIAALRLLQ